VGSAGLSAAGMSGPGKIRRRVDKRQGCLGYEGAKPHLNRSVNNGVVAIQKWSKFRARGILRFVPQPERGKTGVRGEGC
jgi:hypothetical protein